MEMIGQRSTPGDYFLARVAIHLFLRRVSICLKTPYAARNVVIWMRTEMNGALINHQAMIPKTCTGMCSIVTESTQTSISTVKYTTGLTIFRR